VDALGEGEELDYDPSAYDCLHSFQLEWPCLRCAPHRDGFALVCLSAVALL
jgi:ribosome assembly protein RRB1